MPKQTKPITEQALWGVTVGIPHKVRPDMLQQAPHIRQCRLLVRAPSRVEAARKIVASGLDHRSPAAVSAWLREWASPTWNDAELTAVTDERVYLTADMGHGSPFLPYPDCLEKTP